MKQEFYKLPKDIKSFANYNIYEQVRYFRDKKNDYLAKLSDLHLKKKIDLLLKKVYKNKKKLLLICHNPFGCRLRPKKQDKGLFLPSEYSIRKKKKTLKVFFSFSDIGR